MKAKILLYFDYTNHLGEISPSVVEFPHIHELTNYFRWMPDKAMLLKYTQEDPYVLGKSRTSNIRLSVLYKQQEIFFKDAQQFIKYLDENKEIAELLQHRKIY